MVYVLLAPGFEEAEAIVPTDLLRQGGLDISRRTVAKYRGECGIRCAAERRKLG